MVENKTTKLEITVSLAIFEKPMISKPLNIFLSENKEEIRRKYEKMLEVAQQAYDVDVPFEKIYVFFKLYLKKELFKRAVTNISFGENGYNIIKNIISLINEDELNDDIITNILVKAISENIMMDLFTKNKPEWFELSNEEIEKIITGVLN
ncbi:MAG: hypothetical protein E7311_00430 [Clostridiales bacterium]|nr:hypothetical protein [Clostridiales bacterium]